MKRSILSSVLMCGLLAMFAATVANGQTPDQMIQQAKNELRQATSHMHNGKRKEAAKGVQGVAAILYKIREADPGNSKLELVLWNTEQLRNTLQKRMGTTIVLQTDPGALATGKAALPSDADGLARLAGDLLRKAESEMHNGRNVESKALLDKAAPVVAKLREINATHGKVMVLETSLANQTQTVDDRLAGPAPLVTPAPPATPIAPTGKLPYHTRNFVNKSERQFESIAKHFEDLVNRTSSFDDDTLHNRISDRMRAIEETLPGLTEQAATDGVSTDPRVTGVSTRLAKYRAMLAQSRAGSAERSAVASAAQGSVDADVAALRATFERLDGPYFRKLTGSTIQYNDLDAPRVTLDLIRAFEKSELPAVQKQLDAFAAKYGSTRHDVEEKTGDPQAGYPFEGIRNGIANVAKTRVVMAEDLAQRAHDTINGLPSLHDLYRMNGHDNARGFLKLAEKFSPGNTTVNTLAATIDQTLKADLEAYVKKIEDKPWPGTTKSKEAEAAMKFFEEDSGWGNRDQNPRVEDKAPRHPLGIAITGKWSVQARNLNGDPTMYGIPALVAVQLDREKDMGLARVYSVTMRTMESRNAEMKPPFTSITVGNSYFIKASKVK